MRPPSTLRRMEPEECEVKGEKWVNGEKMGRKWGEKVAKHARNVTKKTIKNRQKCNIETQNDQTNMKIIKKQPKVPVESPFVSCSNNTLD